MTVVSRRSLCVIFAFSLSTGPTAAFEKYRMWSFLSIMAVRGRLATTEPGQSKRCGSGYACKGGWILEGRVGHMCL